MKSLTTALMTLFTVLLLSASTFAFPANLDNTTLVERQTGCAPTLDCSRLAGEDGDGFPHQWILHKQISEWISCGGTTCGVGGFEPQSTDYKIEAQLHLGPTFFSGGIAVSESVQTGTFGGCSAGPRHRVCVYANIWHTDYTVQYGRSNPCQHPECALSDPYVIRAPNTIHNGVDYECATDADCGDKGQEFWIQGPPGSFLPPPAPAPASLVERQGCVPAGSCTSLEGNGDPHQWILHKQLSAKHDCGDTYCTIGEGDQIDYTIHANTHGVDWISGGLAVQESVDTGFHNGCTGGGNQPGQSVCTKAVLWHTDYTVRGGIANACDLDGCIQEDDTTIIRSPNKINTEVIYYCAYDDDCHEQGHEGWVQGPTGSPPRRLVERDCHGGDCIQLEGDGSPFQVILHKQITETVACPGFADDPMCSIRYDQQWVTDVKPYFTGDPKQWIDGGFAVTESVEVGNTLADLQDCKAKPGQSVCVFADVWYTGYTVTDAIDGHFDQDGHTSTIWSPNIIKDRINYVCAHDNDCHDNNDEFWLQTGIFSGPP